MNRLMRGGAARRMTTRLVRATIRLCAGSVALAVAPLFAQVVAGQGGAVQGGVVQGGAVQGNALQAGAATPAWQQYQQFNVPGFYGLAQELVRKELDLIPEQEADIKKLAKDLQEKMQTMYAPLRNATLTNEERTQLYQDMQKQMKELQTESEQRLRKILLPQQMKTLEMAQVRMQVGNLLQYGPALERVGLSEAQKQRIQKNRAELAQKLHDLQREAFAEIIEVLTPEQLEQLKQPFGYGQAGAGAQRPVNPQP